MSEAITKYNSNPFTQLATAIKSNTGYLWVTTPNEDSFFNDFAENLSNEKEVLAGEGKKAPLYAGKQAFFFSRASGLLNFQDRNSNKRALGDPDLLALWQQLGVEETTGKKKGEKTFGSSLMRFLITRAAHPKEMSTSKKVVNDSTPPVIVFISDPFFLFSLQSGILARHLHESVDYLNKHKVTVVFVASGITDAAKKPGEHGGIPPLLEKHIQVVDFTVPTRTQITTYLRTSVEQKAARLDSAKSRLEKKRAKNADDKRRIKKASEAIEAIQALTDADYEACTRSLMGCSYPEMKSSVSNCLKHLNIIDPQFLITQKRQSVNKSGLLEYVQVSDGMDQIGGLDALKSFMEHHKNDHSDEARAFGVEPLRGIILLGIPGTGKSASVKSIAAQYQLPLIRLDMGKVFGSLVGQSEANMRKVLKTVEANAPCILWIDEVEKGVSGGTSSAHTDGGTSSRTFGTLLTWMQEAPPGVTIIATANSIAGQAPEFIRRFDEVFWVDLPTAEEREAIFRIHLEKRGRDPASFNLEVLVENSDGYTGAEIEKGVKESLAKAFYDTTMKKPELKDSHILEALQQTKPLAEIYKKEISQMREDASLRYRFASTAAAALYKRDPVAEEVIEDDDDLDDLIGEEA